ncbi:MAG TPA: alternative ribosome rescue aminoacyl-tRNA hydrolase ArfB [Bacteroidia bacterium]|nr:alternative ribosome rescue aminoacyl-tRNA hydrolase ArfB [Bacteroidia bacterium]
MMSFSIENLLKEVSFKAVRSGGKGGQNVNKVSTKVELSFDLNNSNFLSGEQKEVILKKLSSKISAEGILRLTADSERSQFSNKEIVSEKFLALIQKALTPKKKRVASKPSKASKEERLKLKKEKSEKKELRRKPKF